MRRAASAACAVPPAPSTVADRGGTPATSAPTMPATSVLSAAHGRVAGERQQRVGRADLRARGVATSAATSSRARLSGIVAEKPSQSARAASTAGRSSTPQSIAV